MKPSPHSSARSWNSGSCRRNMYLAHSGMFDQRLIPKAPSGAMSPVETSFSTTITTRPSKSSASGRPSGGGTIFGPLMISTDRASSGSGGGLVWGGAGGGGGAAGGGGGGGAPS